MDAGQMYNEFEIAYEAIASADAPGYEPYEVSILLSEAQDFIIKGIIGLGIETDDKKGLILGPFIETDEITSTTLSAMYPSTFILQMDQTGYWAIINERLKETAGGATVEVKPIDHTQFAFNVDNPYKKPDTSRYFWRWIEKGTSEGQLMVYGPTTIDTYYISYLEAPTPIIVPGVTIGITIDGVTVDAGINTNGYDSAYNAIIHRDIINKAAEFGKAYIGDPQGVQLLRSN